MLEVGATLCRRRAPVPRDARAHGSARAAVGDKFVGVEQGVVLGQSREEYLKRAHAHLEIYTGLENYKNSWRRLGFADEDFVRGGSERLCDALVVHGDEGRRAARESTNTATREPTTSVSRCSATNSTIRRGRVAPSDVTSWHVRGRCPSAHCRRDRRR